MPLRLFAASTTSSSPATSPDALSGDSGRFAGRARGTRTASARFVETHGVQTNEVQRCSRCCRRFSPLGRDRDWCARAARARPQRRPQPARRPLSVPLRARDASAPATRCVELRSRTRRPVPAAVLERELVAPAAPSGSTSPRSTRRPPTATSCCGASSGPGLDERIARLDAAVETLRRDARAAGADRRATTRRSCRRCSPTGLQMR